MRICSENIETSPSKFAIRGPCGRRLFFLLPCRSVSNQPPSSRISIFIPDDISFSPTKICISENVLLMVRKVRLRVGVHCAHKDAAVRFSFAD